MRGEAADADAPSRRPSAKTPDGARDLGGARARYRSGTIRAPVSPLLTTLALLSASPALDAPRAAAAPGATTGAEPLALEWSAPAECPGRDEVVEAAMLLVREGRLTRDPGAPRSADGGPTIRAQGRVDGAPGPGYRLHLAFTGAGVRELPGETCEAIAEAAALLLAIAVEPAVMGGADPREEASPAPTPSPPAVIPLPEIGPAPETSPPEEAPLPGAPPPSSREDEGTEDADRDHPQPGAEADASRPPKGPSEGDGPRPSPRRRRPLLGIKGLGGLNLGILPSPAAFAGLGLSLEWQHARVELVGSFAGPSRTTSTLNPEIGGRFNLWHAALRGCGVLPLTRAETPRLSAPLCAGLHLGAMSGRGEGALIPNTAYSPWIGLSLAAALRTQLHRRVALWLEAEGLLSALRPRFHTDPTGALWQADRVGARVGLALEIRLDLQRAALGGQ